jgi:hypothetical protein
MLTDEQRKRLGDELEELSQWFTEQPAIARTKFKKYLTIEARSWAGSI